MDQPQEPEVFDLDVRGQVPQVVSGIQGNKVVGHIMAGLRTFNNHCVDAVLGQGYAFREEVPSHD